MDEKKKVVSLLKFFIENVDGCLQHLQSQLPEGELFSLVKFEQDGGNAIIRKMIDIFGFNQLIEDLGLENWKEQGLCTFNESQKITKDMFRWE